MKAPAIRFVLSFWDVVNLRNGFAHMKCEACKRKEG